MGVVGDVHACDDRLSRLLAFLHDQSLDTVVCVGDIVNGPGDPNRCADLLHSHGVVTVRGNHDRWLLEGQALPGTNAHRLEDLTPATLAFLRALPTSPAVWRVGSLTLVDSGSLLSECSFSGAIIDLPTGTASMLAVTDDSVELSDTQRL